MGRQSDLGDQLSHLRACLELYRKALEWSLAPSHPFTLCFDELHLIGIKTLEDLGDSGLYGAAAGKTGDGKTISFPVDERSPRVEDGTYVVEGRVSARIIHAPRSVAASAFSRYRIDGEVETAKLYATDLITRMIFGAGYEPWDLICASVRSRNNAVIREVDIPDSPYFEFVLNGDELKRYQEQEALSIERVRWKIQVWFRGLVEAIARAAPQKNKTSNGGGRPLEGLSTEDKHLQAVWEWYRGNRERSYESFRKFCKSIDRKQIKELDLKAPEELVLQWGQMTVKDLKKKVDNLLRRRKRLQKDQSS